MLCSGTHEVAAKVLTRLWSQLKSRLGRYLLSSSLSLFPCNFMTEDPGSAQLLEAACSLLTYSPLQRQVTTRLFVSARPAGKSLSSAKIKSYIMELNYGSDSLSSLTYSIG